MLQIAYQMAQTLLCNIEAENIVHAHSEFGHITVSIGVACVTPNETNTLQDLISHADEALYRAKKQGRNKVCV